MSLDRCNRKRKFMGFGRKSWLRYRVILYTVVAVGVFLYRNHIDWNRFTALFQGQQQGEPTLVLAGRDLAPGLVDILVDHYGRDYPRLDIRTLPGGTNQALEDLVNRRADVAFLSRPPTPDEQDLFRHVDGDTAIVEPVGLGGILLLAGSDTFPGAQSSSALPGLTVEQLGGLMAGDMQEYGDRFYAADPNLGHWAAAAKLVGRAPYPVDETTVVYLANDREVARAVANDPRSLGMVVSFDLPAAPQRTLPVGQEAAAGPGIVPLVGGPGGEKTDPTYENVASGAYPLFVSLFVACRTNGGIQGGKFLTHLASGRGQRQIERAGCIPAKQVLREIYLSTEALGE
jgi:ABC-type phosphate transport system substrate-binding protein